MGNREHSSGIYHRKTRLNNPPSCDHFGRCGDQKFVTGDRPLNESCQFGEQGIIGSEEKKI